LDWFGPAELTPSRHITQGRPRKRPALTVRGRKSILTKRVRRIPHIKIRTFTYVLTDVQYPSMAVSLLFEGDLPWKLTLLGIMPAIE
jgi:hypothetical protein